MVLTVKKTKDVSNLERKDIDLRLTSPGRDEEVATWSQVFGIQERYKALLCEAGVAWLDQILDPGYPGTRDQRLDQALRFAERFPFLEANFLKAPFLLACKSAGIIRPEKPEQLLDSPSSTAAPTFPARTGTA